MLTDEQLDDLYESGSEYAKTLSNFCKGLQILQTLSTKDEYRLQGEHDEIFVFAGPPTSNEQQIKLDRLGFRYDPEVESWRYLT